MNSDDEATRFLNVDLELYGHVDMQDLIGALEPNVIVLHHDPGRFATVELPGMTRSIDEAIQKYFGLFTALSESALSIWERCDRRLINIGIQSAEKPRVSEFGVSTQSITHLSLMRAEVMITVYGFFPRST